VESKKRQNPADTLEKEKGIVRIGWAMHARRRFEEAAVDGAESGKIGEAFSYLLNPYWPISRQTKCTNSIHAKLFRSQYKIFGFSSSLKTI
jgi:hypothetical protein